MRGASHVDAAAVVPAIPIMVLSLVYQNVVPTICFQLGCDLPRIRTSIVVGSLLPTLMFIAWSAVVLGSAVERPRDPIAPASGRPPSGPSSSPGAGACKSLSTLASTRATSAASLRDSIVDKWGQGAVIFRVEGGA